MVTVNPSGEDRDAAGAIGQQPRPGRLAGHPGFLPGEVRTWTVESRVEVATCVLSGLIEIPVAGPVSSRARASPVVTSQTNTV